jgi:uncharacterized membrane protein YgcG
VAAAVAAIAWTVLPARADDDPNAPPNLVPNPGLERWADWTPVSPTDPKPTIVGGRVPDGYNYEIEAYETKTTPNFPITVTYVRDDEVKHGGDYSVKITNASLTDIGGLVTPQIAVYPNTTYKVKFWYKGDSIVLNQGDGAGAIFWVNEGNAADFNKDLIITGHGPDPKSGTFDWTPYEVTFTTAKTTGKVQLVGQLRRATGSLWLDDFSMSLVQKPDASGTSGSSSSSSSSSGSSSASSSGSSSSGSSGNPADGGAGSSSSAGNPANN